MLTSVGGTFFHFSALMNTTTPAAEGPQEDTLDYGCSHYKRKSKFVTPCCEKMYTCRFCHDEQEDHTLDRKAIKEVTCAICDTKQVIQKNCQNCGVLFGKYSCLECNLFDDEDKSQFHCSECGICRVGGADRFFHCKTCNMCLPLQLKVSGHKCIENVSHSNCPVCLEDIHTSRLPCHIPTCGHLLHRLCFEKLLKSSNFSCPICQKSLVNMDSIWEIRDREVESTPMPAEYSNYFVEIQCKDCYKKGMVKFHIIGLKCTLCGSYNTYRLRGPLIVEGAQENAENILLNDGLPERNNENNGDSPQNN